MQEERIKSIIILLSIAAILCNHLIESDLKTQLHTLETKNEDLQYQYDVLGMQLDHFRLYYNETYGEAYDFKNDSVITGLAYGDYIKVWTQGRTIIEVLETCTHEYAHNNLMMEDLQ